MKELKPSRRPMVYYAVAAGIMLLLLNAFVFPALLENAVKEVGYNEFLGMIDEGVVTRVARDETGGELAFTANAEGREQHYKTGIWPDDTLVERLRGAGVEFSASIPTQRSPILGFLVSWFFPILLFIGLGRFMMNRLQGGLQGGVGNALSFGKANAKIYVEAQTGKSFDDVAGQDEAKEALLEIVDFLHNPERYAGIGAKLPKGALLVGPPGTGKTLLAKAVAGEANVPFFSISGSEFVEMFVGMGAAKVRDLFAQADQKAPCIVFIDEIDTIGKRRDNALGGNDEREQTLNQLLTEMDGFDARRGVVILAATNRPESLDPALLRPGRFDRRIPVELPDLRGRTDILRVHARGVKIDPDIDFEAVARATSGASGADLANIVNEAALRAVRMGREIVKQSDLDESVEVVIAGYARKNAVISPREKRIVAYHEIGHALVAARLEGSAPVHKITIVPRTSGALGYTMQVDESERFLMSKDEALGKIATLTGGRSAEEIAFGTVTTGAASDIEQATRIARAMVTRYGMSDAFGMVSLECEASRYLGGDSAPNCSSETAARIDAEVVSIIEQAHRQALGILRQNEPALHRLAAYLVEKETISGEEFHAILNRPPADEGGAGEEA